MMSNETSRVPWLQLQFIEFNSNQKSFCPKLLHKVFSDSNLVLGIWIRQLLLQQSEEQTELLQISEQRSCVVSEEWPDRKVILKQEFFFCRDSGEVCPVRR
jgi:hypothetical protein